MFCIDTYTINTAGIESVGTQMRYALNKAEEIATRSFDVISWEAEHHADHVIVKRIRVAGKLPPERLGA